MSTSELAPLDRARLSLEGLSVGDALGQQFFSSAIYFVCYAERRLPPFPWRYTDDTVMALSIYETLESHLGIEQDVLAERFARRFAEEPQRGYGPGAMDLLRAIAEGGDWQALSASSFGGQGSLGNGSAMRIPPLGAYFADDFALVRRHAALSAEVTHAHPEGAAGAIATATAAAWAWRHGRDESTKALDLIHAAIELTPPSRTRDGLEQALHVPLDALTAEAASQLGDGGRVTVMDTVPFCLWCAAANLRSYEEAIWQAIGVGGDIDTNCAIIGGIVSLATGVEGIPAVWRTARESLPLEFPRI